MRYAQIDEAALPFSIRTTYFDTPRVALKLLVAAMACIASGCSGPSSPSASVANAPASSPQTASAAASSAYKGPLTPCDKELSSKDVADILTVAPTINRYSMAQSVAGDGCELGSGSQFDAFVDIAVKKGNKETFAVIAGAQTRRQPLNGIGDEAFDMGTQDSNIRNATETSVYARKGELICDVSLIRHNGPQGDKAVVAMQRDELVKKLGGLCSKVFAARS